MGTAEGAGQLRGIWERDGGGVAGIPLNDAAREGEEVTVELEHLSHGERRTKNISDRVPNKGRAKGLLSGGMPRKGWDTDGNEDAFLQPACLGHRDYLGVGKPPIPKVLKCNMMVPWRALNGKDHDTAMCRSGAERKRRRMAETKL